MHKFLVIDDETFLHDEFRWILREKGSVRCVSSVNAALEILAREVFDVVFVDVNLPDGKGLNLVSLIKCKGPDTLVLMISGIGEASIVVDSIKEGADDYFVKPFCPELLLAKVEKLLLNVQVQKTQNNLIKQAGLDEMVGFSSPRTEQLLEEVRKASELPVNVLLLGETGVGKSLIARLINQRRKLIFRQPSRPFVERNCAAIPDSLIESELFGSEKGAFTGAESRAGAFEQAHGGDIFLDEITEGSSQLQVKLLSVLQNKEIVRVGGIRPKALEISVICASNRSLDEILKNSLRMDLYYRISTLVIHVPSLRERREDLPVLANRILAQVCSDFKLPKKELSEEALVHLQGHGWPGNIRELKSVLTSLVVKYTKSSLFTDVHIRSILATSHGISQGAANLSWSAWLDQDLMLDESFPGLESVLTQVRTKLYDAASRIGHTRSDIARRLGIHRSAVTNYFRNQKILS